VPKSRNYASDPAGYIPLHQSRRGDNFDDRAKFKTPEAKINDLNDAWMLALSILQHWCNVIVESNEEGQGQMANERMV
jgi:hypothetical protein